MQYRISLFSIIVLLAVLPVVLWMVRRFSGSLMLLEKEALKVRQFDFSESAPFDSIIKEIHSLIQAFGLMKSTIGQRTDALISTQKKLENLVKSGVALAAEHDMDSLLRMIFGTARELAYRLGREQRPKLAVPVDQTVGPRESRGADLSGCQVHSVRLPGYVASVEAIFGVPQMQLSLRHDAGTSAQPYVDGTLLAIRKVSTLEGLHRGLDTIMDF